MSQIARNHANAGCACAARPRKQKVLTGRGVRLLPNLVTRCEGHAGRASALVCSPTLVRPTLPVGIRLAASLAAGRGLVARFVRFAVRDAAAPTYGLCHVVVALCSARDLDVSSRKRCAAGSVVHRWPERGERR